MQFPAPTGYGSDRLRLRLTACQTQINGSKYFQILESSYHFYFSIFNTMHDRTIYGEYHVNRLILFCSSLLQYTSTVCRECCRMRIATQPTVYSRVFFNITLISRDVFKPVGVPVKLKIFFIFLHCVVLTVI